MKRVLIIYPGFPHYRNGIIEELLECKDVEFYFLGDKEMMKTSIKAYDFKGNVRFSNASSFKIFKFIFHKRMISYVLKNKFDAYIFHSSPFWLTILICVIIAKFKRKPILNWTHGILKDDNNFKTKLYVVFYKFFDVLLLYGDIAKKNMEKQGIPAEKLEVIYNSLDYKNQIGLRNSLSDDQLMDIRKELFANFSHSQLIFIGRLTKQKKLKLILEAVEILKARGEIYNVLFVGTGPEKLDLEVFGKEKGLSEQVKFYGPSYNEAEIYRLIACSDCCISTGEVGLTAIHSLMYGTPVISHNNPNEQMPEFEVIIDGYNGALFNFEDVDSLADVISGIFSVYSSKIAIRNNCYSIIDKKYNPKNQLDVMCNVLFRI